MTETEWLEYEHPNGMHHFVGNKPKRKLRLFACACCRRIWHLLTDERCRRAVEIAEQYADGLIEESDCAKAWRELALRSWEERMDTNNNYAFRAAEHTVELSEEDDPSGGAYGAAWGGAWDAAYAVEFSVEVPSVGRGWVAGALGILALVVTPEAEARRQARRRYEADAPKRNAREQEEKAQCSVMRDIFGNPFRPVPCSPAWRTSNVISLAQTIYDERQFDRMPILGDALEDAGCTSQEILNHCRQTGEHVKGCWVVDLILGKE
jgi:hypothetical protein